MSSWTYALTNKGRQLQAKAQTGVQLLYTRMAVGSGTLSGQSLAAMTALITPVKNLEITRLYRPTGATRAIMGATLSNADVTTGFYLREIGIYANDPDEGEILYMYANAGTTADYIAPSGDGIIKKLLNMNVIVGSATNVTANIDESLIYVTRDEFEEALANIDVDVSDASLNEKGIVQLTNAVDSTSEVLAGTAKAVKTAYDRGSAGVTAAATAQSRADSAFTEATAAKQLGVEQKNNVVAALNSIGVTASTSETWPQLIAKMAGVIRATGNATVGQVLSGATFSNASGNGRTGTMPNRSAQSAHQLAKLTEVWQGDRAFFMPPDGYFDGQSWVYALTPDLLPSNIRSGKSILGVAGTLNEGPKYASGVAITTSDAQRLSTYWERGSNFLQTYFVVNNLGFRPNRIIVKYPNFRAAPFVYTTKSRNAGVGDYNFFGTTTYYNNQILEDNVKVYELTGQNTTPYAYVNDTGFLLPSMGGELNRVEWEAFGV
ncbi:tail fiber protein [Paenibacillus sp. CC-CFT742]|nr:tail fiber protein [Paenibacillus sp. CC-CFT742]WJH28459.1 tail fiber protein [Paenibacillus sp. CC-CFT742]